MIIKLEQIKQTSITQNSVFLVSERFFCLYQSATQIKHPLNEAICGQASERRLQFSSN